LFKYRYGDKMSVTTKTGDDGYTNLLDGKRVHKYDLRVELLGAIDELTSAMGVMKSEVSNEEIKNELSEIQASFITVMAQIAHGSSEKYNISQDQINKVEGLVQKYESMYIPENKFILPGKTKASAQLDLSRAIARRVERQVLTVNRFYPIHENCRVYLNRVSDYLYSVARHIDFKEDIRNKILEIVKGSNISNLEEKAVIQNMNLELAKKLLSAVEDKAKEMDLPVVIAVSNEWGNIIAVHFMDGALPGSYDIAVDKAYTSAALRLATDVVGELSQSGAPLYGIGNTNKNRIVTFGGGLPLKVNNKVIGGIGVSGGSAEQDSSLALYGAEYFNSL
jgi:ATP:cob(I)alamin adenosyltransferase